MTEPARHVVVVGGGIAGLAAAYEVTRSRPGTRVTVVEAGDRVGGKLRTEPFAGRPLDTGADMWLAAVPDAAGLARDVGLGDELVPPATTDAAVVVRGRLRRLPKGTALGVPTGAWPVLRSRVLSPAGVLRAGVEPLLPGRLPDRPVSVAVAVGRRFGSQVVDRLVDPLLGGVYAGRAADLDLDAAAPQIAAVARQHRSLLLGLRAQRRGARPPGGAAFLAVRPGQAAFAEAVAAASGAEVLLHTRAALLERVAGNAWRVTLAGGRALVADAVVLATPAPATAALLRPHAPAAADALDGVRYATVAIVALAYPRAAVSLPPGSGLLVPGVEGRLVKAVTFTSQKWAHHAGGDQVVLRCSAGRAGDPPPESDEELLAGVRADLAALLGVRAEPAEALVVRWRDALPQYAVGHRDRVARVSAAVEPLRGLTLAGAAYDGVGVPACIRSGRAAGARVVAGLAGGTMDA